MKRLGSVALISFFALLGCENTSRLDKTTKAIPKTDTAPAAAEVVKADHSGTLEDRVARIENTLAKYGEALEFLNKVYSQQKAQQQAQEREEPAPDAVFAVDIAPDVKAGQVEGPAGALVTIVEAWDFA
ncbi:MAG TPA: hypothetical protein VFT22_32940 [Kofleriaceae bacterium]|nr:hypothetical protein [Kofleriaceae bacterium]